ncbi:hypothetical protein ABT158_22080 [Nonomuraea sp. NPDC001636]|uniref:hypothetical protein n=1 Tax=Nonomuraea sp. NPDC001636 TaxID=3154391 RepID=UPI003328CF93
MKAGDTVSEAFAAAIRRRVDEAAGALRAAEQDGDADAALSAAGGLDEVLRMARAHGVNTDGSPGANTDERPGADPDGSPGVNTDGSPGADPGPARGGEEAR